jgi:TolB-like protein/Tfp pilus assembly protein PilF
VNAEKASFLEELKRRHVWRVAVAYVVAGWLLVQVATQVFPFFNIPSWVVRLIVLLIVIGFPVAVVFAWVYELSPEGIRRTAPADSPEARVPQAHRSIGQKLNAIIIAMLVLAVALMGLRMYAMQQGNASAPAAAGPPAAAHLAKSIAVLPFENLSNDKDNAYFVAGMQDLILTKLADIGGLKVIARTSTAKYASHPDDLRTIGQQLGVATILEGSVQKQGDQVLINLQLIDTKTDGHIWAQAYTRTLDNVFGVEGDVAENVATALKAKLSPAESARLASDMSASWEANNLYLRADQQANRAQINYDSASWKAAIPLYQQAIQHTPDFALAYARLSYAQSELAWFGGGGQDVPQLIIDARRNAWQALKLAPSLPAAQLALGYSDYYGRGDYAGALKAFAAALALRPSDADTLAARGFVQRRQGNFDAAIDSLRKATALDPRNSSLAFELGSTYTMADRYPDAERAFQRALALDPHNLNAKSRLSNAIVYATGDIPRALAAAQGNDPLLQLQRVSLLTYQRKYSEALALLDAVPDTADFFGPGSGVGPKAMGQAELYRLLGDMSHARPLYTRSLPQIRAPLAQLQGVNQALQWNYLAAAELGLGNTAQGMDAIVKSRAIIDDSHDNVYGPIATELVAALYAEARRPDLAVPLLAKALASPGIGAYYSPVLLWLDPMWDPIRHDTGFQALLLQYAKYKPAVLYPTTPASAAHSPAS